MCVYIRIYIHIYIYIYVCLYVRCHLTQYAHTYTYITYITCIRDAATLYTRVNDNKLLKQAACWMSNNCFTPASELTRTMGAVHQMLAAATSAPVAGPQNYRQTTDAQVQANPMVETFLNMCVCTYAYEVTGLVLRSGFTPIPWAVLTLYRKTSSPAWKRRRVRIPIYTHTHTLVT